VAAIGASPFEYPEIGLAVTNAPGSTPGLLSFAIKVTAPDVLFLVDDGMPVDLNLSAEEHAKAMTAGIAVSRQTKAGETVRQLRVVVMDRNSNLAGALTMPMAGK
jgi:hypothetical protein